MSSLLPILMVAALGGSGDEPAPREPAEQAPDGWRSEAPRDEIAPSFRVDRSGGGSREIYLLGMAGRGDPAVDGRWVRVVPVTAGVHYEFRAEYQSKNVEHPQRSVLGRVDWLDDRGRRMETPEYPLTSPGQTKDGWTVLAGVYAAPRNAAAARLELHLRWAAREARYSGAASVSRRPRRRHGAWCGSRPSITVPEGRTRRKKTSSSSRAW